jgi:hypothetical protein
MNSSPLAEKSPANAFGRNAQEAQHTEHAGGVEWADLIRIGFVVLAAAAVWFRLWEPYAGPGTGAMVCLRSSRVGDEVNPGES